MKWCELAEWGAPLVKIPVLMMCLRFRGVSCKQALSTDWRLHYDFGSGRIVLTIKKEESIQNRY